MAIREVLDMTKEQREAHHAKTGQYNEFPPNWREVDEKEYVQKGMRRVYSPRMVEFRQVVMRGLPDDRNPEGRDYYHNLNLEWFHDGNGSAYTFDYWAGKMRYFFFATCEHTMAHVSRDGNCLNTYRCTKCGYTNQVDSSD